MIAVAMVALVLGGFVFWLLVVVAGLFMMAEWADLHGIDAKQKRLTQYSLFVPLALMGAAAGGGTVFPDAGAADRRRGVLHRHPSPGKRVLALGTIYVGLPILSLLLIPPPEGGRRLHAVGPGAGMGHRHRCLCRGPHRRRPQDMASGQPQENVGGAHRRGRGGIAVRGR